MAIEIDGFAVLGAMARRPDVFPAARAEVSKTAKGVVGKQLKDKALTVASLRAIGETIAFDSFDLIVDSMSDAEIKAMLAKVDKLNAEVKSAPPQVQRKHVADLARGAIQPAVKSRPAGALKAPGEPKAKVERSGNSKAMRAKKKV